MLSKRTYFKRADRKRASNRRVRSFVRPLSMTMAVLLTGTSFALIPIPARAAGTADGKEVVRVCVNAVDGLMHLTGDETSCARSQGVLTWNVPGPPGPDGAVERTSGLDGSGEVLACMDNATGVLRAVPDTALITDQRDGCRSSEVLRSWRVNGPQGLSSPEDNASVFSQALAVSCIGAAGVVRLAEWGATPFSQAAVDCKGDRKVSWYLNGPPGPAGDPKRAPKQTDRARIAIPVTGGAPIATIAPTPSTPPTSVPASTPTTFPTIGVGTGLPTTVSSIPLSIKPGVSIVATVPPRTPAPTTAPTTVPATIGTLTIKNGVTGKVGLLNVPPTLVGVLNPLVTLAGPELPDMMVIGSCLVGAPGARATTGRFWYQWTKPTVEVQTIPSSSNNLLRSTTGATSKAPFERFESTGRKSYSAVYDLRTVGWQWSSKDRVATLAQSNLAIVSSTNQCPDAAITFDVRVAAGKAAPASLIETEPIPAADLASDAASGPAEPVAEDPLQYSNGCGGQLPSSIPGAANVENAMTDLLNTANFVDSTWNPAARKYTVNFKPACDLHDAGYQHKFVQDIVNGGEIDYRTWTREQIDFNFRQNLQTLCEQQIIPDAAGVGTEALRKCKAGGFDVAQGPYKGAQTYYDAVSLLGASFYTDPPAQPTTATSTSGGLGSTPVSPTPASGQAAPLTNPDLPINTVRRGQYATVALLGRNVGTDPYTGQLIVVHELPEGATDVQAGETIPDDAGILGSAITTLGIAIANRFGIKPFWTCKTEGRTVACLGNLPDAGTSDLPTISVGNTTGNGIFGTVGGLATSVFGTTTTAAPTTTSAPATTFTLSTIPIRLGAFVVLPRTATTTTSAPATTQAPQPLSVAPLPGLIIVGNASPIATLAPASATGAIAPIPGGTDLPPVYIHFRVPAEAEPIIDSQTGAVLETPQLPVAPIYVRTAAQIAGKPLPDLDAYRKDQLDVRGFTANAGADQTVPALVEKPDGTEVPNRIILDGVNTSTDGRPQTFRWTQISGPKVNWDSSLPREDDRVVGRQAIFSAPTVSRSTPVWFELEVTDGRATSKDRVRVLLTSSNHAPQVTLTSDAPTEGTPERGQPVTVTATVADPERDPVTVTWRSVTPEGLNLVVTPNGRKATFAWPDHTYEVVLEATAVDSPNNAKTVKTVTVGASSGPLSVTISKMKARTLRADEVLGLLAYPSRPDVTFSWARKSGPPVTFYRAPECDAATPKQQCAFVAIGTSPSAAMAPDTIVMDVTVTAPGAPGEPVTTAKATIAIPYDPVPLHEIVRSEWVDDAGPVEGPGKRTDYIEVDVSKGIPPYTLTVTQKMGPPAVIGTPVEGKAPRPPSTTTTIRPTTTAAGSASTVADTTAAVDTAATASDAVADTTAAADTTAVSGAASGSTTTRTAATTTQAATTTTRPATTTTRLATTTSGATTTRAATTTTRASAATTTSAATTSTIAGTTTTISPSQAEVLAQGLDPEKDRPVCKAETDAWLETPAAKNEFKVKTVAERLADWDRTHPEPSRQNVTPPLPDPGPNGTPAAYSAYNNATEAWRTWQWERAAVRLGLGLSQDLVQAKLAVIGPANARNTRWMSCMLGRERQRQLLGAGAESLGDLLGSPVEPNGNEKDTPWARVETTELAPLKQKATSGDGDCGALINFTSHVLGVERQKQLLGAGEESNAVTDLLTTTISGGYARCIYEEYLICLETRDVNFFAIRAFKQALGSERQRQLLGLSGSTAMQFEMMLARTYWLMCKTNTNQPYRALPYEKTIKVTFDTQAGDPDPGFPSDAPSFAPEGGRGFSVVPRAQVTGGASPSSAGALVANPSVFQFPEDDPGVAWIGPNDVPTGLGRSTTTVVGATTTTGVGTQTTTTLFGGALLNNPNSTSLNLEQKKTYYVPITYDRIRTVLSAEVVVRDATGRDVSKTVSKSFLSNISKSTGAGCVAGAAFNTAFEMLRDGKPVLINLPVGFVDLGSLQVLTDKPSTTDTCDGNMVFRMVGGKFVLFDGKLQGSDLGLSLSKEKICINSGTVTFPAEFKIPPAVVPANSPLCILFDPAKYPAERDKSSPNFTLPACKDVVNKPISGSLNWPSTFPFITLPEGFTPQDMSLTFDCNAIKLAASAAFGTTSPPTRVSLDVSVAFDGDFSGSISATDIALLGGQLSLAGAVKHVANKPLEFSIEGDLRNADLGIENLRLDRMHVKVDQGGFNLDGQATLTNPGQNGNTGGNLVIKLDGKYRGENDWRFAVSAAGAPGWEPLPNFRLSSVNFAGEVTHTRLGTDFSVLAEGAGAWSPSPEVKVEQLRFTISNKAAPANTCPSAIPSRSIWIELGAQVQFLPPGGNPINVGASGCLVPQNGSFKLKANAAFDNWRPDPTIDFRLNNVVLNVSRSATGQIDIDGGGNVSFQSVTLGARVEVHTGSAGYFLIDGWAAPSANGGLTNGTQPTAPGDTAGFGLPMSGIHVIYTDKDSITGYTNPLDPGFTTDLKKGLAIIGSIELPADLNSMLGKTGAQSPGGASGGRLIAEARFQADGKTKIRIGLKPTSPTSGFTIFESCPGNVRPCTDRATTTRLKGRELYLEMTYEKSKLQFQLTAEALLELPDSKPLDGGAPVPQDPLTIGMRATLDLDTQSLTLALFLTGTWRNALGINGLDLADLVVQGGVRFNTVPPNPQIGMGATIVNLPADVREKLGIVHSEPMRFVFNISTAYPIFELTLGSNDGQTFIKPLHMFDPAHEDDLQVDYASLVIAPNGGDVGPYHYEPGISLGFGANIMQVPVSLAATLDLAHSKFTAHAEVGEFASGDLKVHHSVLDVAIDGTSGAESARIHLEGGFEIAGGSNFSGRIDLNAGKNQPFHLAVDIDATNVAPAGAAVTLDELHLHGVADIPSAAGAPADIDFTGNAKFTIVGARLDIDGAVRIQQGELKKLYAKVSLSNLTIGGTGISGDGCDLVPGNADDGACVIFDYDADRKTAAVPDPFHFFITGAVQVAGFKLKINAAYDENGFMLDGSLAAGLPTSTGAEIRVQGRFYRGLLGTTVKSPSGQDLAVKAGDFWLTGSANVNLAGLFGATLTFDIGHVGDTVWVKAEGSVQSQVFQMTIKGQFEAGGPGGTKYTLSALGRLTLAGFTVDAGGTLTQDGLDAHATMNLPENLGAIDVRGILKYPTGGGPLQFALQGGGRINDPITHNPFANAQFKLRNVNDQLQSIPPELWFRADVNLPANIGGVNVEGRFGANSRNQVAVYLQGAATLNNLPVIGNASAVVGFGINNDDNTRNGVWVEAEALDTRIAGKVNAEGFSLSVRSPANGSVKTYAFETPNPIPVIGYVGGSFSYRVDGTLSGPSPLALKINPSGFNARLYMYSPPPPGQTVTKTEIQIGGTIANPPFVLCLALVGNAAIVDTAAPDPTANPPRPVPFLGPCPISLT